MGESRKIVVRIRLSWPSRFSTGRGPISGNCGTYFITAPLDIQASAITSVRSDRIRLAQVRPPAPQSVVDHRRRGYESRFGKIEVFASEWRRCDRLFLISGCSIRSGSSRHGDYKRSEEHTSELQSLMRISYAVFCLKKKKYNRSKSKLDT